MQIYVVQEGDNVDRIAARTGIPVETLIYDNQIEYCLLYTSPSPRD